MGFAEVLTIIFVILKATGTGEFASWSWWWVVSPLWITYGIVVTLWLIGAALVATGARKDHRLLNRKFR